MLQPGETTWTTWQLLQFFGPKVFYSVIAGGIIGLERELKNKAAGMKTNILICLGSALFTSVSILISTSLAQTGHYGDPARIAAQIVSGIGFLGGGAIIQSGGTVLGLTTAATIWVVAAIGVLIGIGYPEIAFFCSVSTVVILVLTNIFEAKVLGRALTFGCQLRVGPEFPGFEEIKNWVHQALVRCQLTLEDFDLVELGGENKEVQVELRYSGLRQSHRKFVIALWAMPGVKEVKQK